LGTDLLKILYHKIFFDASWDFVKVILVTLLHRFAEICLREDVCPMDVAVFNCLTVVFERSVIFAADENIVSVFGSAEDTIHDAFLTDVCAGKVVTIAGV
jgi:hypothetical protein